jgi:hypothetical protein
MLDLIPLREFERRAEAALPGRGPATARDTLDLTDAAFDLIVDSGETIHPIALAEDGDGVSPLLLDRINAGGMVL